MKTITSFKNFENATSHGWFSSTFAFLRIVLGILFLSAGIAKFGTWSAEGYLSSSTGPFSEFFQSLAGSPVVDQLNVWGLTLIGVALILGIFVRPASFFGIVIMLLYYLAHFEQNTAHGIIDSHIIYILIFVIFLGGGAGHVFGLDGIIKRQMRKSKLLSELLFG